MQVSPRTWSTIAWALFAGSAALTGLAVVFALGDGVSAGGDLALDCVLAFGTTLLGAFILTRHPRHPIGWLFALSGSLRAVAAASETWSRHTLVIHPGSLPGGAVASWLAWAFLPTVAAAPMIVVLFPDGRLPGRAWRAIPALAAVVAVLFGVVIPIALWPYRGSRLLPDAPAEDIPTGRAIEAAIDVGLLLVLAGVALALASVVVRARRERGDVRQQVKWFGIGAAGALVLDLAGLAPVPAWIPALGPVAMLTGIGLGVFRYRLYDVDRMINRTLVYGLLTLTLVAGFAGVDVTLALIVGQGSAAAAAVSAFTVALLLRPVRERLQDFVDRVFDRRHHDAVNIVRALSQRVGHEQVDPRVVRDTLRTALRDPTLQLYFEIRHSQALVDPDGAPADPRPDPPGRTVDRLDRDGNKIAIIVHRQRDPRLRQSVFRAATPVLEHARLQTELSEQLVEVRASRARLASAADAERRRIERDLHDGAQQRLVGLALHVQSARRRGAYPPDVDDLLAFTVDELQAGIADLRGLVHGLLPPALTASGLPAAIADLARPDEVFVTCDLPGRLPPNIEATAWFVACEGIANARKHAPGQPVEVDVSQAGERLLIRIADRGPGGADPHGGGLRHLADRVEAHGGFLRVESPVAGGTRLHAELPCGS